MTNPADENDELEVFAEVPADEDTDLASMEDTTDIPDEKQLPKKKIAALQARHDLEDYFELKKMREALDYLFDEEESKEK